MGSPLSRRAAAGEGAGHAGIGDYYAPLVLKLNPVWDPIRNDPRFQALLKKYTSAKLAAGSSVSTGQE